MPFEIRSLRPDERREAVAVLARAFWNDPLFDWFARDLLHEQQVLPFFFGAALADVVRAGEVTVAAVDGRPRGVAMWMPPGSVPRSVVREGLLQVRSLRAILRAKNRAAAIRLLQTLDKAHPHDPHWYLFVLGVDPTLQGRGAGGALIEPFLDRADREGLPAYLETQKFSNVAYYRRFGFEPVNEISAAGGPTVWCMRRNPRES